MLKASGIKKQYGKLQVLKGIDLFIEKGEVVSIVGASGAGKSTLLHILGTLDRPDTGQLEIDGVDIFTLTKQKLARFRNQSIGFVFQFHNLLPEFNAMENISIPAFIAGTRQELIDKKAREIMTLLGIWERRDHKPGQLSGGEQQRVAVARALINDPTIIFADEPSGNLDSANARELHKLFFDLRKEFAQSFVIVTHNEELANMADRKIEIQDGIIFK